MHDTTNMTDLEVVDLYIVQCRAFVNPQLLGEITRRGLYNVINFLGGDTIEENKAIARGRMAKMGKYFGEPEIDKIAGVIQRIEFLLKELNNLKMTDVNNTLPLINEMKIHSEYIKNYFNKTNIP